MTVDLRAELCGVAIANPLVLASGVWGSGHEMIVRAAKAGAGAVTTKSCSVEPRTGHPNPTVLDWGPGLINAVGLTNPGALAQRSTLLRAREELQPLGVPLIASVFGDTASAYRDAVRIVAEAAPDMIELNISCPNVESEFGRPFALDPVSSAEVVRAVRSVYSGVLLVKLSPNTPLIVNIARSVVEAGADGLTAVNTLGPGMIIDVRARRPVLSNLVGGVSGPALRPVAVRCVYDIAQAVDVPIVGTGGVESGEDALQMIMAGASAVGIGSVLRRDGAVAFSRILGEMRLFMDEEGYSSLDDIRGCAHV